MTDQTPDLAALEALAEAATPTDWHAATPADDCPERTAAEYLAKTCANPDRHPTHLHAVWVPELSEGDGKPNLIIAFTGDGPTSQANAAYIAAAHPGTVLWLIREVERLTAERQAFVAAIGYGDGITEPAATLPELIDPLTAALDAAHEHDECPVICELCGENLAATRCPECHGSGCLPNPQLAYLECGMCAGVGRIHEGCAEASYAALAQRAENAEAEVERLRESIAGSPNKAQRLTSLVASSTRLVQIERDDARARAEKAEATIERVRELADSWTGSRSDLGPLTRACGALLRAALDGGGSDA